MIFQDNQVSAEVGKYDTTNYFYKDQAGSTSTVFQLQTTILQKNVINQNTLNGSSRIHKHNITATDHNTQEEYGYTITHFNIKKAE